MDFHCLLYGQFTNSKWWSEWVTEMDAANDDSGRKISD